jgi:2,4'-dihydroxyacetophenone dioxygenase
MTVDPHAAPPTGPAVGAGDVHDVHALDRIVEKYARTDIFVAPGEKASPWVPFIENVYIRHLSFDVRTNTFVNILRVDSGGRLGRHKHRGPVSGTTGSPSPEDTCTRTPGPFTRSSARTRQA